jgi:AP-2 complex subunit mu-1
MVPVFPVRSLVLSHEIHRMPQVTAAKEDSSQPPIKRIENHSFLYTRHHNMYFVALTKSNINPALVFE